MESFEEFRGKVMTESLSDLASQLLQLPTPFAFVSVPAEFAALQYHMHSALALTEEDSVRLIGSGLTGFSLGLENLGAAFSPRSDLDVVIVSASIFDSVCNLLLEWRYPWHTRKWPKITRDWAHELLENLFAGSCDPSALAYPEVGGRVAVPTTKSLQQQWFNAFKTSLPGKAGQHELSGRLYRSEHHLHRYLQSGLEKIKLEIGAAQ